MTGRAVALLTACTLTAGACSSSHGNTTTPTTLAAAKVGVLPTSPLQVVANPDSVLSFELKFTTPTPAITTLHVDGPGGGFAARPESTAGTTHDLPVVGLRARSTYEAWVTDASGAASKKVTITTPALPADLPSLSTAKSTPAAMAPGVTLFTVTPIAPPNGPLPKSTIMPGNLIAVDATGAVVWYHRASVPIGDAKMLPNGDIVYEYNDMGAQEIDLLGRVVREWAGRLERGPFSKDAQGHTIFGPKMIPLDFDSIHHELTPLPDGNFLTISNELRTVGGFTKPLCGESPAGFTGTYKLITDVVTEFDPTTGRIVHQYPIADYLHPQTNPADANICGFGGSNVYPNFLYAAQGDVHDWTHVNAVILDAPHNRLLVSIRHLDAILAIKSRDDASGPAGTLLWRMGPNGGDFTMTGNGAWHYHQHAIELEPDGSLLMFDNGNERPDTKPLYSRAVRYRIDDRGPRSSWTVTQTWEYKPAIGGKSVYAFFVGDANLLGNGNVLVDTGGINPAVQGVNAQIDEVQPAGSEGGTVVFQLRVLGPAAFAYRAIRLPSLYGNAAQPAT